MGIAPTRADQRLLFCDTCETQATHTPHALRGQRDRGAIPSSFAYVDTGSTRHAINTQECDRTSPSNAQPIAPDALRWAKQRQAHSYVPPTKTPRPHPDVRQNGANTTKPTHSLRPRVARPMSHTAPHTLPAGDRAIGDDGGDGGGDAANDECMHHGPCKWDAAETPHPESHDGTFLAIKRTHYLRLGNKLGEVPLRYGNNSGKSVV